MSMQVSILLHMTLQITSAKWWQITILRRHIFWTTLNTQVCNLSYFLALNTAVSKIYLLSILVYCDLDYTLSSQLISLLFFLIASANRTGGAPQICQCVSKFCRLVYKLSFHLNFNFTRKHVKPPSV